MIKDCIIVFWQAKVISVLQYLSLKLQEHPDQEGDERLAGHLPTAERFSG